MPLILGFLQVACFDFTYGWIGIFLYSGVFLICSEKIFTAFVQGFLYGFIFFSIHSWGFNEFIDVNLFPYYYKVLPIIFYMLSALYGGAWFASLALSKKHLKGWQRYIGYFIATSGYFWLVHSKHFAMFFIDLGYPLAFPFSTIVNNNALTYMFYLLGLPLATGVILAANSFFAYFLESKREKTYSVIVGVLLIALGITDLFRHPLVKTDVSDSEIIHMRPPYKIGTIYQIFDKMSAAIQTRVEMSTKKNILFAFPESALPFYFTDKTMHLLPNYLPQESNIQLLIGTHIKKDDKLYNNALLLQKGRIILRYDKKKLLPFWEFIPCASTKFLGTWFGLFLKGSSPFEPGVADRQEFFYFDGALYLPSLCSELFWNDYSGYSSDINIICLLNDSHFGTSLIRRIMFLYGRFVAGMQHRKVLYMCHYDGFEIGENGLIVKKL